MVIFSLQELKVVDHTSGVLVIVINCYIEDHRVFRVKTVSLFSSICIYISSEMHIIICIQSYAYSHMHIVVCIQSYAYSRMHEVICICIYFMLIVVLCIRLPKIIRAQYKHTLSHTHTRSLTHQIIIHQHTHKHQVIIHQHTHTHTSNTLAPLLSFLVTHICSWWLFFIMYTQPKYINSRIRASTKLTCGTRTRTH